MNVSPDITEYDLVILLTLGEEDRPMQYGDILNKLNADYHANPDNRFTHFPSILVPHIQESTEKLESMGLVTHIIDEDALTHIGKSGHTNKPIAFQPRKGAVLTDTGKTFIQALLNPRPQRARNFQII